MDPALYKAAVEGNAEDGSVLQQKASEFSNNVTPKGNTVLHVAALYGHTNLVQKILELCDPSSLLCALNKKNETALHIAAKEGHDGVVSALVCCAKTCPELESGVSVATKMLRMSNCDNDTALHMAARGGHNGVPKQLAEEDVEFEFSANKMGETPLYLAAESRFHDCLLEMLNSSRMPTYGGPFGRTALHAAIISESADCTKALLARENSLCEVADDYGWTPLHYAAKFCDDQIIDEINGVKSSLAYLPARRDSGWTTAFHIAASEGRIKVMEAILKHCPDAWEMVDSKGRNVLHEAVVNDREDVAEYILNHPNLSHLIDEKDEDGNTPIHLCAVSDLSMPQLVRHARAKQVAMGFNKRYSTPLDIFLTCNSPGSMQGMALLIRKAAFRAFVIADTIAFVCYITSLVGYTLLVEEAAYTRRLKTFFKIKRFAILMFDACLVAVVLAFVTASYTVLVHSTTLSTGVISVCICVCVFGIISFPIYLHIDRYDGRIFWLVRLKILRRSE